MFGLSVDCCFFFKQKTAYEMRISDWSSDVCSSDLSRWRSQLRPHSERPLSAVCSHKPILKAPVLRHPPSHCTSASERTSRSASWPPSGRAVAKASYGCIQLIRIFTDPE